MQHTIYTYTTHKARETHELSVFCGIPCFGVLKDIVHGRWPFMCSTAHVDPPDPKQHSTQTYSPIARFTAVAAAAVIRWVPQSIREDRWKWYAKRWKAFVSLFFQEFQFHSYYSILHRSCVYPCEFLRSCPDTLTPLLFPFHCPWAYSSETPGRVATSRSFLLVIYGIAFSRGSRESTGISILRVSWANQETSYPTKINLIMRLLKFEKHQSYTIHPTLSTHFYFCFASLIHFSISM